MTQQSDTHHWIALVPFRLTLEQAEAATRGERLQLVDEMVDEPNLPPVGCYECECLFTSAAALQPCPKRAPQHEAMQAIRSGWRS